jgi:hypothetical protein
MAAIDKILAKPGILPILSADRGSPGDQAQHGCMSLHGRASRDARLSTGHRTEQSGICRASSFISSIAQASGSRRRMSLDAGCAQRSETEPEDFFIGIGCNPLKSPDFEKEMKEKKEMKAILLSFIFIVLRETRPVVVF